MFFFEVSMFLTEPLIMAAALTLQFYNMTSAPEMAAYAAMRSYSILCAVTTFACLVTTLALILLPHHWWAILEAEGVQVRLRMRMLYNMCLDNVIGVPTNAVQHIDGAYHWCVNIRWQS
jgi:hypothetical protein